MCYQDPVTIFKVYLIIILNNFLNFILFYFIFFTLQYFIGVAIHQRALQKHHRLLNELFIIWTWSGTYLLLHFHDLLKNILKTSWDISKDIWGNSYSNSSSVDMRTVILRQNDPQPLKREVYLSNAHWWVCTLLSISNFSWNMSLAKLWSTAPLIDSVTKTENSYPSRQNMLKENCV